MRPRGTSSGRTSCSRQTGSRASSRISWSWRGSTRALRLARNRRSSSTSSCRSSTVTARDASRYVRGSTPPPGKLGKTIRFVADPGLPPVRGDETSIQQVVHNLISNAIKYSPDGSDVDVQVAAGDGEVLVRVLDRGRGLPADDAAHVFEPFYRGSPTEQMVAGIGIGLFVCQRLVEAMGGRLWTTPREGGGSEFGFALSWWPIEADEEDELGSVVRTAPSA